MYQWSDIQNVKYIVKFRISKNPKNSFVYEIQIGSMLNPYDLNVEEFYNRAHIQNLNTLLIQYTK